MLHEQKKQKRAQELAVIKEKRKKEPNSSDSQSDSSTNSVHRPMSAANFEHEEYKHYNEKFHNQVSNKKKKKALETITNDEIILGLLQIND